MSYADDDTPDVCSENVDVALENLSRKSRKVEKVGKEVGKVLFE